MSLGAREEDRDRIVGSLETIIQTLVGRELDSLRQSVSELNSEVTQRIDNLKRETAGNVEALRATMLSDAEESKQEVRTALAAYQKKSPEGAATPNRAKIPAKLLRRPERNDHKLAD